MICNLGVEGSNPPIGSLLFLSQRRNNRGKCQSGQLEQTVNLPADAYGGSNPSLPTICGSSSVGRASAFQAEGREFEPRFPLKDILKAGVAQG